MKMNSNIEFTFPEINALNKILAVIKTEAYLTADEINFFALSPLIISVFEKVHKEYMNHLREQQSAGKLKTIGPPPDLESMNDFQLSQSDYIGNQKERLLNLDDSGKKYIKSMDQQNREEYCDLIFAPFIPTDKQKQDIIELLKFIAESN